MFKTVLRNVFRFSVFDNGQSPFGLIMTRIQSHLSKGNSFFDSVKIQLSNIKTLQHSQQQPFWLNLVSTAPYEQAQQLSDLLHKNIQVSKFPTTFISINNKIISFMNKDIHRLNQLMTQTKQAINHCQQIEKAKSIASLQQIVGDRKLQWFPEKHAQALQHYMNSLQTAIDIYSHLLNTENQQDQNFETTALLYLRFIFSNAIKIFNLNMYHLEQKGNPRQILDIISSITQNSPKSILHKSASYFNFQIIIFSFASRIYSTSDLLIQTETLQKDILNFLKSNPLDDFQTIKQISMAFSYNSFNNSSLRKLPSHQKILKMQQAHQLAMSYVANQELRQFTDKYITETFLKQLEKSIKREQ